MRISPPVSTLAAAFALLVLPAALSAQTAPSAPAAARPPGCRGTTSSTSSVSLGRENAPPVVFPGYAEIDEVQPGSPAEKAGFKRGDKVILQNGRDLVANPPPPALAGDTVVFTVDRNGAQVPLTVVMGRWDPPQEAPGVTRICRPLAP